MSAPVSPVALRHYVASANLGDAINPALVARVTGRPTYFEWDIRKPHLLAIGSIIDWATAQSHVWGSGVIDPARDSGGLVAAHVWALRGKLSVMTLKRAGLAIRDVPLGDPGFLVADLFGLKREHVAPRYRLGLVPHLVDRASPVVAALARNPDTLVLDIAQPAEAFFDQMRSCEAIASSSLHGLVFAEALGIPNLWLRLSGGLVGGSFKFHDWFSTMGRPQASAYVPTGYEALADMVGRCETHAPEIDMAALAGGLPETVLDELSARARGHRVGGTVASQGRGPSAELTVFVLARSPEQLTAALGALAAQSLAIVMVVVPVGCTQDALADVLAAHPRAILLRDAGAVDVLASAAMDVLVQRWFAYAPEPGPFALLDSDGAFLVGQPDVLAIGLELLESYPDIGAVGAPRSVRAMARAALRTRSRGAIPGAVPPQLADAQIQVRETRFGRFEMTWQDGDMRFKMRRPGSSYLQSAPMICLVADSELWNGGPMSLEAQVRLSYDPGPHRGEAGTGPRPAEWQGADR